MHHETPTDTPTASNLFRNLKAERLVLQRFTANSYPELTDLGQPGPSWISIGVLGNDVSVYPELTDAQKKEAQVYMLRRIRLALMWLETLEQTGIVTEKTIADFTPVRICRTNEA